jgi:hypothetical protein
MLGERLNPQILALKTKSLHRAFDLGGFFETFTFKNCVRNFGAVSVG